MSTKRQAIKINGLYRITKSKPGTYHCDVILESGNDCEIQNVSTVATFCLYAPGEKECFAKLLPGTKIKLPIQQQTNGKQVQPSPFIIAPNVILAPTSLNAISPSVFMPGVKALLIPTSMGQNQREDLAHRKSIGRIETQQNGTYFNPVHAAVTKHGKILFVAGSGNDDKGLFFRAALFDPTFDVNGRGAIQHQLVRDYNFRSAITVQYNTVPASPLALGPPEDLYFNTDDMPPSTKGLGYDMFGNGFGFLESCEILLVSGVEIYDIFKSTTRCAIFDPHTETFKHAATLSVGRWYPTVTTLPSGHLFTVGGLKGTKDSIRYNSTNNTNTDIYDPYAYGYDRGDNMIDPVTKDYYHPYPTQAQRKNGTADTAKAPIRGMWMTHSLSELKNGKNAKLGPDGLWETNDQNTEINEPGAFVPAPYQRHMIAADTCGSIKAAQDPQCNYHGEGSEFYKAADGNNYDIKGRDYSPLHNDIFSAVPVSIRDSHMLAGTPMFQSAIAEDAEQPRVDMYPRQHLLKDGNVFIAGWEKETWEYHPHVNKYDNHQDTQGDKRIFGTSVILPLHYDDASVDGTVPYRERVLILGGLPSYNRNIPAANTTEIIDLTKFPNQNRTIPKYARNPVTGKLLWQQWQHGPSFDDALGPDRVPGDKGEMVQQNATLLPDGTVFIQGGSRIDEIIPTGRLETFLYIPDKKVGKLVRGPNVKVQRQYHGVTLLLPDGTVGIYGGNPLRGYNEVAIEIYEPSYLFDHCGERIPDSHRPKILNFHHTPDVRMSDDCHTNYLDIEVDGLSHHCDIKVSLARNGGVTHAFNSEQRVVTVEVVKVSKKGGNVRVKMPKFVFPGYNSDNFGKDTFTPCPPGCYMVFVFVNGIASVSKIVRLIRATGAGPDELPPAEDHGHHNH